MATKRPGLRALADLLTPMSVRVAATLGIADHIAAGHHHPTELARDCNADPYALERLLRHLCTIELLEHHPDSGYHLTSTGEQLRSDHPGARRPWLDANTGVGRGDLCFIELLHTIRTGQPAYPQRYGTGFWDDLERDPELSASFDALMNHHVNLDKAHEGLATAIPWQNITHVIDVGGGNGALALHLLNTYPHLNATVIDRPGPISRAQRDIHDAGLHHRATGLVGDFFEPLPAGADAYVLSAILHDWDDTHATTILSRCADAATATSKVLVVEAIGADGEQTATAMDLRMLAYNGGCERGVTQLNTLAAAAGLKHVATHRVSTATYMGVIEYRRATPGTTEG